MPPQESGLTYNTWFGRPHLEMTWWHITDFALWNHPETVQQILAWYNEMAYPVARQIAQRQGFKGVRWMKMTDPWAGEAPSNTGSFLLSSSANPPLKDGSTRMQTPVSYLSVMKGMVQAH